MTVKHPAMTITDMIIRILVVPPVLPLNIIFLLLQHPVQNVNSAKSRSKRDLD